MQWSNPTNTKPPSPSEQAAIVLDQARALLSRVRTNLDLRRFGGDEVLMKEYNELAVAAFSVFPNDRVLGELEEMPDALLRTFGTPVAVAAGLGTVPPAMATERLEGYVSRLVNRLEQLLGSRPMAAASERTAKEVLATETGAETRAILDALEDLRRQQPELPPIDVRTFDFLDDRNLRSVLSADYLESQRAFSVEAFKATALLAGGIVEGMLMDALQNPKIVAQSNYSAAVAKFPTVGGTINWDRVNMAPLIAAAVELQLLDATTARLAEGARDFRDTVHPNAEFRQGIRAQREEAELLLALVRLIYRQLAEKL